MLQLYDYNSVEYQAPVVRDRQRRIFKVDKTVTLGYFDLRGKVLKKYKGAFAYDKHRCYNKDSYRCRPSFIGGVTFYPLNCIPLTRYPL